MKSKILDIVLLLLLQLMLSCNSEKSVSTETGIFILETEYPQNVSLLIENQSQKSAVFKLKLNNGFFYDTPDLISAIKDLEPEFAGEPYYRKAWRFVSHKIFEDRPLTQEHKWQHNPFVLINSIGFGICDDKAAVLSSLWKTLGYKSRVWTLEGHVVPEIFIKDHWEMYDPHYKEYYFDSLGNVADVKMLMNDPSLINKPVHPFFDEKGAYKYFSSNSYSTKLSRIYSSSADNKISTWFSDDKPAYRLTISIPAGGTFEFPARYENELRIGNISKQNKFANAKLTIPAGWTGNVSIPLVIHKINGKGNITINGGTYKIESAALNDRINDRTNFNYKLRISNLQTKAEIIYLINPDIQLKKKNKIHLEGNNIGDCNVTLIPISQKERIIPVRLINELLDIKDFEKKKNAADSLLSNNNVISDKESFFAYMNHFFVARDFSNPEKDKRMAKITANFDRIVCALDTDQQEKFYNMLNNGALFVTTISILENEPDNYFDYIITHLKIFLKNNKS